MKKRYNIWLDEDLIKEIKNTASLSGLKISTFIRMCILNSLNKISNEREKNKKS